jgi:glycosyltransferase involved in cell wall biosynthesis
MQDLKVEDMQSWYAGNIDLLSCASHVFHLDVKIVWINKRNWKHPGPIVNMSVHNAYSFASIGLDSHLCLGADDAPSDTNLDLRDFYALEPISNFKVHRVPRKRGLLGGSASASVYSAAVKLIRELATNDEVAVFTRDCGFLSKLAWMCRRPRVRGFYELHDLWADLSWRGTKPHMRKIREMWLERLFLPHISGLVCITREMEKLYQHIFPNQETISMPLGTKTIQFTDPEVKRRARTIFYVGHMHGPKGVTFLQNAAIALAAQGVRTEFWGGYEKDAKRIREAAAQHGLSDWIIALPFQPPSDLHKAFAERASLGVVMLADNYYNRYLTCPVKALDYLTHGIPALGTDIPSVREILDDAGIYLHEGDQRVFVREALSLLDNPQTYAAAVAKTRIRSAMITWQARAKAISEFAKKRF